LAENFGLLEIKKLKLTAMEVKEEIKYQVGEMTKDPRDMSDAEREKWQKQCTTDARKYLFSIGQPMVYKREDGHTVAEYEDGRIEIVR
jgi:predicted AAA+ superfamily ATPase